MSHESVCVLWFADLCSNEFFFRLLRRNRILWLLASVPYYKDLIWLVGQIFYVSCELRNDDYTYVLTNTDNGQ